MENGINSQVYNDFNAKIYEAIPQDSKKILDLGCSTGILGKKLLKNRKGIEVVGIDINTNALKIARSRLTKVLKRNLNSNIKLPYNDGHFDCIVVADVIEHLNDSNTLLVSIKRYLSKNGVLIVSVPNFNFVLNRFLIFFGMFKYTDKGILDKGHLRFFTQKSVKTLLETNGYEIVHMEGYINTRKSLKFMTIFAKHMPSLFAYQLIVIAESKSV